ncbi:MAG: zf-TFIIB domain-containing protein [Cystobacter sp.]
MTLVTTCPHCAQPLTPFTATARTGVQAELARCSRCAGFWAPSGRLQDTFGAPALPQLVGGETQRKCIECRILMTPALLPSGTAVEVCSACRGMFLDAGELASLGIREEVPVAVRTVPPPPPLESLEAPLLFVAPADTAPAAGFFACIECGEHKPLREGQALRDGLACRACMRERAGH